MNLIIERNDIKTTLPCQWLWFSGISPCRGVQDWDYGSWGCVWKWVDFFEEKKIELCVFILICEYLKNLEAQKPKKLGLML